jgi:hypothetical protein
MTHYGLYAVLANGGKWDSTKDPFAAQQVAVGPESFSPPAPAPSAIMGCNGRSLKVSLIITTAGRVSGDLFSSNGKRIMHFDAGVLEKGKHDVSFPLDNYLSSRLNAGAFICALKCNGVQSSKMVSIVKL